MKRTVESIVREMENSGAMMKNMMTNAERLQELDNYQKIVVGQVFKDEQKNSFRLCNVKKHMKELAENKGLAEHEVIRNAIKDMDDIEREIKKMKSGIRGEKTVRRVMKCVNRNKISLENVNLSDGEDRTEIDQIVITSSGILLLEVKNYKNNIVILESGKVGKVRARGGDIDLSIDKTLGEQMNIKRHLLRTKLEKALDNKNVDLQLHIESRVVFSNSDIIVTDNYKHEKYCYTAGLVHEIDNFTSGVHYSEQQMRLLESLINEFKEEEKAYNVSFDFDRIRRTFAESIVLLENEETLELCEGEARLVAKNKSNKYESVIAGAATVALLVFAGYKAFK